MTNEPRNDRSGSVLLVSAFVLLWRIAAAASPYREGVLGSMTEDPLAIRWALGVMGILFMACGLYAFARDRSRTVLIFALYGCTGGLHWGGPISFANSTLEAALFLFYFLASDHLGQALFLHFTLLFTRTSKLIDGRRWLILYVPAMLGSLVSLGIIALPPESAASGALQQIFWLLMSVMIVYDLAVLTVLVNRVLKPVQSGPTRKDLFSILGAFAVVVLATLLPAFGSTLAARNGVLSFAYVLIPLTFAFVIARQAKQRAGGNPDA